MKFITRKFADFPLLDFGNKIQISGMVLSSADTHYMVSLPGEDPIEYDDFVELLEMSADDWEKFLRQSDLLEVEKIVGTTKVIVRKSQRQIDQAIAWNVFRRDGFRCRYCGREEVPLTVDHIVPWESGGPTIEKNLLSACKPCNKARGNMTYNKWLVSNTYMSRLPQNSWRGILLEDNANMLDSLPELEKIAAEAPAKRSR